MDIPTPTGLWLIYPDPTLSLKETLIIVQFFFYPVPLRSQVGFSMILASKKTMNTNG